jgi:hypothetical protein
MPAPRPLDAQLILGAAACAGHQWPVKPDSGFGWCWLPFDHRQIGIEAGPRWGRFRPDGRGGSDEVRIVERAHAHEDEVRTRLGLTKDGRAALGAEAAVHDRAAVRATYVVGERPGHGRVCFGKAALTIPLPAPRY